MKRVKLALSLLFSCCVYAVASTPKPPVPLVHYSFDNDAGEVALDLSGHGHHGTLHEIKHEDFGVHGQCIRLNGKSSYLKLPVHPDLNLKQDFTLSIFFKMDHAPHGMSLFNYGNCHIGWSSYIYRTYVACVSLKSDLNAICYRRFHTGTDRLRPFVNLTMVFQRNKDQPRQLVLRYYLNGQLLQAQNRSSEFLATQTLPILPQRAITIGNFATAESQWFSGLIDEVKIFNSSLSAEEVAAEYKRTIEYRPSGRTLVAPVLQDRPLPPLARRRLAIYQAPKVPWIKPELQVQWLARTAESLGCTVTVLDSRALSSHALLSPRNFDTLILPAGAIPLEGEDSIFQFLVQGGNLITATVVPDVFKQDKKGNYQTIAHRKTTNHPRGWHAPFLLRNTPGPYGNRPVREPLTLNPAIAQVTGKLLPAVIPPMPKVHVAPLDNWTKLPEVDGCYGDATNYPMGADSQLNLYQEASGIGADMAIHRYYNGRIFGATLIQLGKIGTVLLNGKQGKDAFQALLLLMEHMPNQQPQTYYRQIVDAHIAWSELGFDYHQALGALKDAAIYAHLNDREWKGFADRLKEVEQTHYQLARRRKNQAQLLMASPDPIAIAKATKDLLEAMAEGRELYRTCTQEAQHALAGRTLPKPKNVKHKYGTLPSIASLVLPTNLARMRGPMFDTMKRIGINVYSGPLRPWHSEDPQIQRKMDGLMFDYKFVYPCSARVITGGGMFNPASGTVKDGPLIPFPYAHLKKLLTSWFDNKKWLEGREFRIGTGDETGLGFRYWGEEARHDFHGYLTRYFDNNIDDLNRRCQTQYRQFAEIQLPTRQPKTRQEHAIWELWRKCREYKLETLYLNFYNAVKAIKPNLDVFQLPSTGATAFPIFGINYYNVTKYQDVSGMDGTACGAPMEWLFNDLTTKRTLTSEWGGLYQPSTLQYVQGQLWEELTGGALGFEQHLWSFGNDSCNFADFLDYPTNYGALLQKILREARQLDFLFLDGKRATPEIGILFSHASRMHDQPWGWGGEKTFSPHMHTVSAYYALFLRYGRSARVIPEETLAEGRIPKVQILVVPHACFLAPDIQRQLLTYVAQGGRLLLEGRSGQYDTFGAPADLLFKACQVVPAFTRQQQITLGTATLKASEGDRLFSLSGKGKSLADYSSTKSRETAILTASLGKGSITFLGFSPGLRNYAALPAIIETIMRNLGLSERFRLSDDAAILREWTHDKDTYLMITSKEGAPGKGWGLKKIRLSIRGQVELHDYLFNTPIKGTYRHGYTHVDTIIANGGRAFRIAKGTIAPATDPAALSLPPCHTLKNQSGTNDQALPVTLPFQGKLFDVKPLRWNNYIFSLTTLGSGDNDKQGESYLTIEAPGECIKKRIATGETHYYRMRQTIFKVTVVTCYYMYPFYSVLNIQEVPALPPSPGAQMRRSPKSILLANGMIRLEFLPQQGAAIRSMQLEDDRKEQLVQTGAGVVSGGLPGPYADQPFKVQSSRTPHGLKLVFTQQTPAEDKHLTQTVTMPNRCAAIHMTNACRNTKTQPATFDFRFRPMMALGGSASSEDAFFIPTENGVKQTNFRSLNSGSAFKPSENWAAVVDRTERLAYVNTFHLNQVSTVYVWEATDCYNFEIFAPSQRIAPGKNLVLDLDMMFFHGLSGVDQVVGYTAAFVDSPPILTHDQTLRLTLQIATARHDKIKTQSTVRLTQAGKTIRTLQHLTPYEDMTFELPLAKAMKTEVKDLPDGDYQLQVTLTAGKDNLTFNKPIRLCGQEWTALEQDTKRLAAALKEKAQKLSPETYYAWRIDLENLRGHLADGNFKTARKLIGALNDRLKSAADKQSEKQP